MLEEPLPADEESEDSEEVEKETDERQPLPHTQTACAEPSEEAPTEEGREGTEQVLGATRSGDGSVAADQTLPFSTCSTPNCWVWSTASAAFWWTETKTDARQPEPPCAAGQDHPQTGEQPRLRRTRRPQSGADRVPEAHRQGAVGGIQQPPRHHHPGFHCEVGQRTGVEYLASAALMLHSDFDQGARRPAAVGQNREDVRQLSRLGWITLRKATASRSPAAQDAVPRHRRIPPHRTHRASDRRVLGQRQSQRRTPRHFERQHVARRVLGGGHDQSARQSVSHQRQQTIGARLPVVHPGGALPPQVQVRHPSRPFLAGDEAVPSP
ncbi:hypothetical protein EWB00_000459 [Schistosoma japonicum]|uniref:Uncharacterized protein n=1 Tax=Schistosoma japonicum TaxID=6182 RepID=A0A4Z2CKF6_SCHJA|nr:hypothetical protein EWB00_000459 [Schistosoma japonicum]